MLKCQKDLDSLLSASFCDSQRTQTSKSVLVLTLRQALQRVRRCLTARPCRKLKARCTSEGSEEQIWLRYLRQLSQSCCSYIRRLRGKKVFLHPWTDTDDPSRNSDSHSRSHETPRYISRTFYKNCLLGLATRVTKYTPIHICSSFLLL